MYSPGVRNTEGPLPGSWTVRLETEIAVGNTIFFRSLQSKDGGVQGKKREGLSDQETEEDGGQAHYDRKTHLYRGRHKDREGETEGWKKGSVREMGRAQSHRFISPAAMQSESQDEAHLPSFSRGRIRVCLDLSHNKNHKHKKKTGGCHSVVDHLVWARPWVPSLVY